jgi:hypothetical protein
MLRGVTTTRDALSEVEREALRVLKISDDLPTKGVAKIKLKMSQHAHRKSNKNRCPRSMSGHGGTILAREVGEFFALTKEIERISRRIRAC